MPSIPSDHPPPPASPRASGPGGGAAAGPPVFGPDEVREAEWLIERALAEDLPRGDLTSDALFGPAGPVGPGAVIGAEFTARQAGVACGLPVVHRLYRAAAPEVQVEEVLQDGARLDSGAVILRVSGPALQILSTERIALNFLQRLSGIASLTRRFVDAVRGRAQLLDTRKTTPGWRALEKYAVRAGGGRNHRRGLSDATLLKDNHARTLRALGANRTSDWVAALRRAAARQPDGAPLIEVEVDTREELIEAFAAAPDVILLDNFSLEDLRWAVGARSDKFPGILLEASGGIRLENVAAVAETGVDRISVGALTHSAPSLDIGLDWTHATRKDP
jgi:nicotinate-nucleotide pyrophosphorylase (carboxylating)